MNEEGDGDDCDYKTSLITDDRLERKDLVPVRLQCDISVTTSSLSKNKFKSSSSGRASSHSARHLLCFCNNNRRLTSISSLAQLGTMPKAAKESTSRPGTSSAKVPYKTYNPSDWTPGPQWDAKLQELKSYKATHGDCKVKYLFPRLGKWVCIQRGMQEHLTPGQWKALDDLGFDWERNVDKYDKSWNEMYDRLADFQKVHGHCDVFKDHLDTALFYWVGTQRSHRLQLSLARQQKLDDIGFQWVSPSKRGPQGIPVTPSPASSRHSAGVQTAASAPAVAEANPVIPVARGWWQRTIDWLGGKTP